MLLMGKMMTLFGTAFKNVIYVELLTLAVQIFVGCLLSHSRQGTIIRFLHWPT
jgi:hypothetical protein